MLVRQKIDNLTTVLPELIPITEQTCIQTVGNSADITHKKGNSVDLTHKRGNCLPKSDGLICIVFANVQVDITALLEWCVFTGLPSLPMNVMPLS